MFKNIEVTQDLLDYIYSHTSSLHPIQKEILQYNKTLGDIQRMQISESQALFLQLDNKISTIIENAEKSLKSLIEANSIFDLVFIDADKANYTTYFDFAINLVKRNGLIIFDNVLWHGDVAKKNVTDNQTELIRKFNIYIKNDKKTEKTILPLGDGLTICRKL